MKSNQSNRRSRNKGGRKGGGQQNRGGSRNKNQIKQKLDKFNSQGRDARQAGDRVAAENFFQHAEHYQRMLNELEGDSASKPARAEANNGEQSPKDGNRIEQASGDAPQQGDSSQEDFSANGSVMGQDAPSAADENAVADAKPKRRARASKAKTEAAE